jgi:hypothetical protein
MDKQPNATEKVDIEVNTEKSKCTVNFLLVTGLQDEIVV